MSEICKHDRLRRSCYICDLEDEVKELREALNRIEHLIRYKKAKQGNLTELEDACFEIVKNVLERSVGNEKNR